MKKTNWANDKIQFPRLLSEIRAIGLNNKQYAQLRESMELSTEEIDIILERAETEFQKIKESL